MQQLISKVIKFFLPPEKIWEIKNMHNIPSMEWSINNLKKLGFESKYAIDVGAYDGEWSKMFKYIFPNSQIVMIEAQTSKDLVLKQVAKDLKNTSYHIALLGAEHGKEVVFNINSTVSSVLVEHTPNDFIKETRQTETVDNILSSKDARHFPDFIKLDVQGYELEVLKGSNMALNTIQFILCEVSLIDINKNSPLITDIFNFLDSRGFIPYDICSFIRRPFDLSLWQSDILFIRKDHPLTKIKSWN